MRLTELELAAFGPFEGERLEFGAERGLEIVCGPNEAGKSTALRAVTGLFYGIPERTHDDHRFPMSKLRLGARVRTDRGEELQFLRRKGRGATLSDPRTGEPIDEVHLERLMGGVPETMFRAMFGLDYATLSEGAAALLAGRGEVGQSLFDAAGGRGAHAVRARLKEECDALFRPNGTKQSINLALARLKDAKARVVSVCEGGSAYETQLRDLDELKREQTERVAERLRLSTEQNRLSRLLGVLPIVRALQKNAEVLAACDDVVLLPTDAREQRLVCESERARIDDELRRLAAETGELERREAVARALASDNVAIDDAELAVLDELRGRVLGARVDLPRRVAELSALDAQADALAAELLLVRRDDSGVTTLDRISEARVERIRGTLGKLEERLAQCDRAATTSRARVLAIEERARAMPEGLDVKSFERVVARARSEASELGRTSMLLDERAERVRAGNERAKLELERIELGGEVPSEEQVSEARGERDRLLSLAEGSPSDDAYAELRRSIALADALADRLRRESERVSLRARFVAELRASERERAACEEERNNTRALAAELVRELVESAPGQHISSDEPGPVERETDVRHLVRLVERAEAFVAAEKEKSRDRSELDRERRARQLEQREADMHLEAAASEVEKARDEWAAAIGMLGLDADLAVEEASAVFALMRSLAEKREASVALRQRVLAMQADVERFAERVSALVGLPLGALAAADAIAQFDAFIARARRATEALETLAVLGAEKADKSRACADAEARRVSNDAAMTRLLREAGTTELSLLPRAEEASGEKRRLMDERSSLEGALASVGGGAPIAELEAEIANLDVDEAQARKDELERTYEELNDEIASFDRKIGSAAEWVNQFLRREGAHEDAQFVANTLAEVSALAAEYETKRLAYELLSAEIERYRSQHQGPVLAAANALFPRLTRGSFGGLRVDYRGDTAALVCLRASGQGLEVEELSQGTRDQLYLALRLATVLRHAERNEPMPLVLDDILVHFDDERSTAAFEVLLEVGARVQVLFFTHHEHLVELARSVAKDGALGVHRLRGAAAS